MDATRFNCANGAARIGAVFSKHICCRRAQNQRPTINLILAALVAFGLTLDLFAGPQGMTVSRGNATFSASGSQIEINASHNALLNWQSFNIGPGESVVFHQPSAASIVWNKINDPNPSQIWGSL